MNNTSLNYNENTTFAVEEHSIEELMESYMMYKIGKCASISVTIQEWVFITGRIPSIYIFEIVIILSLISCF